MNRTTKPFITLLRIICFTLFLGRSWQHLFWDAPFRALLWDESLMKEIVTSLFGIPWQDYVTSMSADAVIQGVIRGLGVFYLIMAILSITLTDKIKLGKWLFYISSILLTLLAFLYCKEKFYHFAQFFEYAIQIIVPTLLAIAIYNPIKLESRKLHLAIKVAIALTFAAHGMYAIGYYPRPGVFIDMTINILGISESSSHIFLKAAGILDFIAAIFIFIPRLSYWGILYCAFWGFVTALARTWANIDFGPMTFSLLHQYLPQTIYRLSHGLLPLGFLIWQFGIPNFNISKKGIYSQNLKGSNIEKTLTSKS